MTPSLPLFVAATPAVAPGTITPSTGTSSSTLNMSNATALTVLHATTNTLMSSAARFRAQTRA